MKKAKRRRGAPAVHTRKKSAKDNPKPPAGLDSTKLVIPDRKLVDYVFPEDTGIDWRMEAQDTDENLQMMGARDFPSELWVEPKDWKEVARNNDRYNSWPKFTRYTNQGGGSGIRGTHECTCHSLRAGMEAAIEAERTGTGNPIALSPLSVYAKANPRQWGGAGCLQVLGIAMNRGMLPEPVWGQEKKFAHTLHGTCGKGNENNSRGPWTPESKFPEGWEETAYLFRPVEVINPRSLEEMVCCLLGGPEGTGRVVNVGRNGHAIPYVRVGWTESGNDPFRGLHLPYWDSYDVTRYDSLRTARSAVGGSSAIWSTSVTPELWALAT